MKIKECKLPSDSLVDKYLPANYTDAFLCTVEIEKQMNADDLQIAFWTDSPKWIQSLFKLRNNIVKLVGLKTDKADSEFVSNCIRNGKCDETFMISEKSENETVVKLSDKHLDAYMSIYIKDLERKKKEITVITVVNIHNWLWYVYFYSICPFHKLVVKGMLRNILKRFIK